jgi:hypothetical protein
MQHVVQGDPGPILKKKPVVGGAAAGFVRQMAAYEAAVEDVAGSEQRQRQVGSDGAGQKSCSFSTSQVAGEDGRDQQMRIRLHLPSLALCRRVITRYPAGFYA